MERPSEKFSPRRNNMCKQLSEQFLQTVLLSDFNLARKHPRKAWTHSLCNMCFLAWVVVLGWVFFAQFWAGTPPLLELVQVRQVLRQFHLALTARQLKPHLIKAGATLSTKNEHFFPATSRGCRCFCNRKTCAFTAHTWPWTLGKGMQRETETKDTVRHHLAHPARLDLAEPPETLDKAKTDLPASLLLECVSYRSCDTGCLNIPCTHTGSGEKHCLCIPCKPMQQWAFWGTFVASSCSILRVRGLQTSGRTPTAPIAQEIRDKDEFVAMGHNG